MVPADLSAPLPALTRDEFAAALHAQGARYWDKHPFHVRLHAGGCTPDEVRRWVLNRWYYQANLSRKNAAIIADCPLPEVRRRWAARLSFQDGAPDAPASGSPFSAPAGVAGLAPGSGLADWLALASAVGVDPAEMTDLRHLLPGVRFAVDAYLAFCRSRPWELGAAAALTELFSPDLMHERVLAWQRHYPWIDPAGYAYFQARIPVVQADSSFTLDLVLDHCRSRQRQEEAIAALAFKCDVLWAILDAVEHAGCRR